jgi:hypothetical protein
VRDYEVREIARKESERSSGLVMEELNRQNGDFKIGLFVWFVVAVVVIIAFAKVQHDLQKRVVELEGKLETLTQRSER